MTVLKSSEEWQAECDTKVLDPDGWDRRNFAESWAELITEEEFKRRLGGSTVMGLHVSQQEWEDSIEWDDEELEAPACDLSNPEVCESCQ